MSRKNRLSPQNYVDAGFKLYIVPPVKGDVCTCPKGKNCSHPGKHPDVRFHPRGIVDATDNPDLLEKAWQQDPRPNLGLQLNGLLLLDLDLKRSDGIAEIQQLEAENCNLPETPCQRTGGGGRHLFFQLDKSMSKKSGVALGGLSIDFKAGPSCGAIIPPSMHQSGSPYQWERSLLTHDLAIAPGWLIDFLNNPNGFVRRNTDRNSTVFVADDLDLDITTAPGAAEGERNAMLCQLAGIHLVKHGAGKNAVKHLFRLAKAWAARCEPQYPVEEVKRTILALARKHRGASRQSAGEELFISRDYTEVEAQPVEWLWPGRIARGGITLACGTPGVGKSLFYTWLASTVSRGGIFPDGTTCEPGRVLIASCEDSAEQVIANRLAAQGADNAMIVDLQGVKTKHGPRLVNLQEDLERFNALFEAESISMLVLDPIGAYWGKGADQNHYGDSKRVLGPLSDLLARHNVTCLGISHLTKKEADRAIHRSIGSIGIIATSRSAWGIFRDPNEKARRVFLELKNNLGDCRDQGLAFQIVGQDEAIRLEWEEGFVNICADDWREVKDNSGTSELENACEWLQQFLADGPKFASDVLKAAKEGELLSERTVRRAKKQLGIVSWQEQRQWKWRLADVPGNGRDAGEDDETVVMTL